ncbi:hypothetical protein [Dongia sp. agr-C8]
MMRWIAPIAACLCLCLAACLTPMRFGAESVERSGSTNGLPTYHAFGHLDRGESGEAKAAKVMQAACPDGNPQLVSGYVITMEIRPRPMWNATFTCDQEIPGV